MWIAHVEEKGQNDICEFTSPTEHKIPMRWYRGTRSWCFEINPDLYSKTRLIALVWRLGVQKLGNLEHFTQIHSAYQSSSHLSSSEGFKLLTATPYRNDSGAGSGKEGIRRHCFLAAPASPAQLQCSHFFHFETAYCVCIGGKVGDMASVLISPCFRSASLSGEVRMGNNYSCRQQFF